MSQVTIETKTCRTCKETKSHSQFHKMKKSKDGIKNQCKSCVSDYRKKFYKTNAKKENAQSKAYREANPNYFQDWTEANRSCGVYCIKCKATGKIYYGSSTHLYRRKTTHWSLLRGGRHWIKSMQEDFNTFGEGSFQFQTMMHCGPTKLSENEALFVNEWVESPLSYNTNSVNK